MAHILVVYLLAVLRRNYQTDLYEIFREGWQWTVNKRINFCGDLNHRLDIGIVFWIRHYWNIRKVLNGHKSVADTCSPDNGTGKTCLAEVCTVPVLLVMVALCNRADHYILILFLSSFFLLLLLLFFPRLISAVGNWMFTIPWHMMWP